ncbi:hypothetical protein A7U60_g2653 [Sanghuangporus baumii]|uniref:Glycosyltransferase family 31 protein n=1 Tax=Sanghuangporus baumii TaxID=108892 RepID=A0A9Q5I263_SANBA|nr:hypothetical protein A7U60_g2653 [Sanghuangporus baumii]
MPFRLNLLSPRNTRNSQTNPRLSITGDYDSSDSTDSTETAKSCFRSSHDGRDHNVYVASSSTSLAPSASYRASSEFLLHPSSHYHDSGRISSSSSAVPTPIPSRTGSPLPQFFSSAQSSSCTSDADSEPTSPLLPRNRRNRWWNDDGRRWWLASHEGRRRRRRRGSWYSPRSVRRIVRAVLRHPLFPTQPTSILLTLLVLTIFGILLTLLLIHVLNPDKEPLPWRAYCSIPSVSTAPPSLGATSYSPSFPFNSLAPSDISSLSSVIDNTFPPPNLDDYPPAGLFLGIFTMDSAVERRMLVRSTWANHERSRNGAGAGDGGRGTSRTIVRFVVGKSGSSWEKRIQLEAETYNDMIVLPIAENMNSGKTHAFFSWASTEAWVPPLPDDYNRTLAPGFSYSNITANKTVPVAKHDPVDVRKEWAESGQQKPWVRPDFIVKVDDDSFVMLAELEARLRVELYTKTRHPVTEDLTSSSSELDLPHSEISEPDVHKSSSTTPRINSTTIAHHEPRAPVPQIFSAPLSRDDPLVYWGYLVKNQFMAGELYALSWSLSEWVARDPVVKGMTKGKEDKQVAKWMRVHPQAQEIRWKSERCWLYDHPKAGTVYSHGFLFPSEVTRIRRSILSYFSGPSLLDDPSPSPPAAAAPIFDDVSSPTSWAHSSVSAFGVRYDPPLSNLTTWQSIEALVEGSDMSLLSEDAGFSAEDAWMAREGRRRRYENKRVGGTIVVHFIKKNPWFLETALALLEGDEMTAREKALSMPENSTIGGALRGFFNAETSMKMKRPVPLGHRRL